MLNLKGIVPTQGCWPMPLYFEAGGVGIGEKIVIIIVDQIVEITGRE